MAFFENAVEVVGSSLGGVGKLALGVGAVVVAPVALPVLRPVTKELIKGGIGLTRKTRSLFAEAGEQWSDLVAEARTELDTPTPALTNDASEVIITPPGFASGDRSEAETEAEITGEEKPARRKRA